MNYSGYYKFDTSNGEGVRCTLFCSGCTLHCDECFNKETWKFNHGTLYTQEFEDVILKDLSNSYVRGLSILGGDPWDKRNIQTVTNLCRRVKTELPEKDIWCWSGNTLLELQSRIDCTELLDLTDTLIDGRFEKDKTDLKLIYRGSSNQRVWVKNKTTNLFEDKSLDFWLK